MLSLMILYTACESLSNCIIVCRMCIVNGVILQLSILVFDYVVLPLIQYLAQWIYGEIYSSCLLYITSLVAIYFSETGIIFPVRV